MPGSPSATGWPCSSRMRTSSSSLIGRPWVALGHAEYLLQLAAQHLGNLARQGLGETGATDLQQAQAAQLGGVPGGGLQPQGHGAGHQGGHGHGVAFDQGEAVQRLRVGRHDDAAAGVQHAQATGGTEGVVVRRRQRAEEARVAVEGADLRAGPHAVGVVVVVVEGIEHQRQLRAQAFLGQVVEERVIAEYLMLRRSDQQGRLDLPGKGAQLVLAVAVQRIDRGDAGLEQGEQHDVELGDVGQLHQRSVALAQAVGGQARCQVGGTAIQFAVADAALAAEDRRGLRLHGGAGDQQLAERLVVPVAGGAIALRPVRGPGGEFDGHGHLGKRV
ncbi:hypothetical protein WR25_23902 [Diploscapter pachys]|uniref:Uncharacterized protein n=1 Tax=Diploscapter pachys TaxID=2018661 RepID=A0A2A2K016_9BILA|nr:hypothetical protein WR25_23902 [Diploscapter pachys]